MDLVDVQGKHYHMEMWHAASQNAKDEEELQAGIDPETFIGDTVEMRRVLLDNETGEPVTVPIDFGSCFLVPQIDGTYRYEPIVDGTKSNLDYRRALAEKAARDPEQEDIKELPAKYLAYKELSTSGLVELTPEQISTLSNEIG